MRRLGVGHGERSVRGDQGRHGPRGTEGRRAARCQGPAPIVLASPGADADNSADPPPPGFAAAFPARSLHAGSVYAADYKTKLQPPALPDFRNLGTVLRILVAVNAAAARRRDGARPRLELWPAEWLDMTAVVEPQLMVELAVLYALAPWLARQTYATGAW